MKQDMQDQAPKTLSVPEAGWRYYGIGRNASYEAAKRGEIPFIRIGRRLRVPILVMERKLSEIGPTTVENQLDSRIL